jgi:hypothetical protein
MNQAFDDGVRRFDENPRRNAYITRLNNCNCIFTAICLDLHDVNKIFHGICLVLCPSLPALLAILTTRKWFTERNRRPRSLTRGAGSSCHRERHLRNRGVRSCGRHQEGFYQHPGIKILSKNQNSLGTRDRGLRVRTDLLTAFPRIKAAGQDPFAMAQEVTQVGYKIMKGKAPESKTILIPVTLVVLA